MIGIPFRRAIGVGSALGAAILLAACAQTSSPPQQVRTDNPSVTYKYLGDQELISANQKAVTYCNQFNAVPTTKTITETSDGMKQVVFDCVPGSAPTARGTPPSTSYTYTTDQELLLAQRNAELYCREHGSLRAVSSISTDADGSKTLTARCAP